MENQGHEVQSTEARTRARKHGHAQSADFIEFGIDDQLFYLVKISPWLPAQHTSIDVLQNYLIAHSETAKDSGIMDNASRSEAS